ncbi:hypothetical protein KAR91_59425, partial [Candidatus Pacearchaeota archaeon]|nr:hypothetical protein [Candidatus Pacearchaeota archaeon]
VDLGNVDLTDLTNTDLDKDILNTLKNIVLSMVVSKELRIGLNDAFGRCLYNNLKIDNETFESVETRSDYFMVCWEVLRFNLSPFLPKIDLLSSLKAGINTNIPKQK